MKVTFSLRTVFKGANSEHIIYDQLLAGRQIATTTKTL